MVNDKKYTLKPITHYKMAEAFQCRVAKDCKLYLGNETS